MSADNPASTEHQPIGGHAVVSSGVPDLPRERSPHAPKFRMVLGLLAVIAVVAVAVAVVVAANRGSRGSSLADAGHWSSWAPDSSGSQGVEEIANFVSPYYRVNGSQQLDVVSPLQLAEASDAGTITGSGLVLALQEGTAGKGSLEPFPGKTIGYNICGVGTKNCELSGTASISRMLMLRREALELALYTFRYIGSSQNVVVVLPPGHTVTTSGTDVKGVTVALLFTRSAFSTLLDVPISKTLESYPLELSQLTAWSKTQDAALVDQVTAHFLFSSQVETLQEGGSALVLTALPAQ